MARLLTQKWLAQKNRVNEFNDSDHRIQGIPLPRGIGNQIDVIDDWCQEKPHHKEDFDQVLQILKKGHERARRAPSPVAMIVNSRKTKGSSKKDAVG